MSESVLISNEQGICPKDCADREICKKNGVQVDSSKGYGTDWLSLACYKPGKYLSESKQEASNDE